MLAPVIQILSVNPEKTLIVGRQHCSGACRRRSLLAQSLKALAFIQRESCYVHECSNIRSIVRRTRDHHSGIRMSNQNGRSLLRIQEVSSDGDVVRQRSQRNLCGSNVEIFLRKTTNYIAPR